MTSKQIKLKPFEALYMHAIEGACYIHVKNNDDFALIFEGHHKRIVGIQLTKNVLLKLKETIDVYFAKQ